jgi:hypothetical protein
MAPCAALDGPDWRPQGLHLSRLRRQGEPPPSRWNDIPENPTPAIRPRLDGRQWQRGAAGLITIHDLFDHTTLALIDDQSNLVL